MGWPTIIFLDIDGVLNSHNFLMESQSCEISHNCVRRLNRIIKLTNAKIVLSSAWRYMIHSHAMTLKGFHYMMRTHGMINDDNLIIDTTCKDETIKERPDQIRAWLKYYSVPNQRYVILDDLDLDWGDLIIIRINGKIGLTDIDVNNAIFTLLDDKLWKTLRFNSLSK